MVTCQSANQLKTPAKVSWAFKCSPQFGSLDYTIIGKTADLTVERDEWGELVGFFVKMWAKIITIKKNQRLKLLQSLCIELLIHEFRNLSWITEKNELFHDILIYWDAPVWLRCRDLWRPERGNKVISWKDTFCSWRRLLAIKRELNERVKAVAPVFLKRHSKREVVEEQSKSCKSNLNEWGHIIDVAISDLTG